MAQAKARPYYDTLDERKRKTIAYWLFAVCFMIFCMVVIGGLTRLTHSGLSMTDWQPIHGIIPPMNAEEWQEEFDAYRQYPEYQKINKGMSLDAFKQIFYVEWIHRIAGRITGLVVLVPLIYFTLRGYLDRGWFIRFFLMGGLIGVQAVIGWLMVQSGMKDNPDVSQYRLATHLTVAFIIFTLFFASALKWWPSRPAAVKDPDPLSRLKKWTHIFAGLLLLQIVIGGFVAGLDAGKIYNTWPLMGDRLVPSEIWFLSPWYLNLFENAAMVQFIHRNMAYLLFAFGLIYFINLYRQVPHATIRKGAIAFLVLLFLQVLLGIKTLILGVPIALGSIHQASALILFASVIFLMVKLKQLKVASLSAE